MLRSPQRPYYPEGAGIMTATASSDGQYRAEEKSTTVNMALAPVAGVTLGTLFVSLSPHFL